MDVKKILVVGSCNTDMVIKSDRLPTPGETVIGGVFLMNPGGKGANQAVAAARQGGDVTFIAKTGNDVFGKQSLELYNSEGINTDLILSDSKNPSGVALIMVNSEGENCISVASGSNANLTPKDIEKFKSYICEADLILMQLEIPIETVEYVSELALKKQTRVILNPAPARILPEKLLRGLFLITPNETEAEILSGIKVNDYKKAKEAADVISEKGVANVVITMGALGAFVKEGDDYSIIAPTKEITAIDTTAAGDCFNGTICVGLSEGKSITESAKIAVKASGLCVQKMGAQSSIPYKRELISSL
ncbi:ribokinase [Winogradskyella sp. SM1960]|uniref:ribokinase n=1 Tax=Winogradskyella sp. SM1960 TaxID=2865955 RepID=UPI001CD27F15|nr:ribokinase [Winogradskyella sp. SM1960]